jgi:hypothetical protein
VQDRPSYHELLEAVQHFLETDVVPALDGTKKFHARVAANVLGIVRRELQSEDAQLHAEWQRLNELFGSDDPLPSERIAVRRAIRARTKELCERISNGDADSGAWHTAVIEHVRQTVVEKLEVANPKYLSEGT